MTILRGLLLLAALAAPGAAPAQTPADGVFPRQLRDEVGEVTIPAEPRRIVAISTGQVDGLLTLGVVPVGAGRGISNEIVEPYHLESFPALADGLRAMTDVGTLPEPDLEAIAALRPDLILYTRAALKETTYAALRAIAPVVVAKGMGVNWKPDFLLLGAAIGRGDAARAVLARYEAETAAVAAGWPEGAAPSVSFVTVTPGRLRQLGAHSIPGGIAADHGHIRPPAQALAAAAEDLSAELLDAADADWIFYATLGDDDSALTGTALWPTLTAVAEGRAVPIPFKLFFNSGPTAARLTAEILAAEVAGAAPQ